MLFLVLEFLHLCFSLKILAMSGVKEAIRGIQGGLAISQDCNGPKWRCSSSQHSIEEIFPKTRCYSGNFGLCSAHLDK